ncbi:hypothetical protein PPL_03262 [Heterostelium album PN500]|uniref:Alkaline phosphatase n=1 Tax=Heterostelium pallidum (strain ATCC 26659 / Pp 5 / PN500) TaxID=670386 RepID=D3B4D9_HETP5|nr:hypothetical protein PPL_03262 [Heterostelium album PN500]EFA84187.1 hypothetical protein PPL_03262 [Heterostelium album PN500]|eukprot:XP_020436304.1 hypothetical protein PPL_03262 [Heterostelium album PN500]
MKQFIYILLLAITLSVVKSEIEFFTRRSADIIIESPTFNQNSLLYLKGNVFNSASLSNLKDTQISALISHVMGTLPMGDSDREGFPTISLFNKPKLNLLLAMDSVAATDLEKMKFVSGDAITIEKSYYPMDSVAEMATIFSGVTPAVHGVVGSHWETPSGERMNAYQKKGISLAANLADVITETYNGKSLIISASSKAGLAGSTAVHQQVAKKIPAGNYHAVYNGAYTMQSIYANNNYDDEFKLDLNDVERILYSKEFKQFILPSGWAVSRAQDKLTFTKGSQSIEIDIDVEIVFLTELASLFNIVKQVSGKNAFDGAVADSVPDMISFSFGAISSIDRSSAFYPLALQLVDQAMSSAYQQLSGLYGGRVACEIVVLPPAAAATDSKLMEQVVDIVGDHVIGTPALPSIYLKYTSKTQRDDLCAQLQESLESADYKVFCVPHQIEMINVGNASSSSEGTSNNTMADSQQTAAFQIFLFLPIVLVLFVIFGALMMMKISFDANQNDTLLFRSTKRLAH